MGDTEFHRPCRLCTLHVHGWHCMHVGALIFKIEAAVRIRGIKTVTDVPAYWMMPANVDKVQAEVDYKIDLSTGAAKKKALDKCIREENRHTHSCQ